MNTICSLLTVLCLVLKLNADCDYFLCYENDHYNRPGQMLHVTKDNSSNTKCIKRSEVPKSKCQIQFNASGDHVVLNTEKVKELNFSYNAIEAIDVDFLTCKGYIRKLDLSHNKLEFIDREVFGQNFPKLRYLDVSHNKLSAIDLSLMIRIKPLRKLSLSNNQLKVGVYEFSKSFSL